MRSDNNLAAKGRSVIPIFLRSLIALFLDRLYVVGLTKNDNELEVDVSVVDDLETPARIPFGSEIVHC